MTPSTAAKMPTNRDFSRLEQELAAVKRDVYSYLTTHPVADRFEPKAIREGVFLYVSAKGKSLRPAFVRLCCEAVGGRGEMAIPAGSAVEIFHTWTLVHDDIIDRDDKRRGGPTAHAFFEDRAKTVAGVRKAGRQHYGLTMALLVGDLQHGWSTRLLLDSVGRGARWEVVGRLLEDLETVVLPELVAGEVLDVEFSLQVAEELTDKQVLEMLWKKTGVLYRFAGLAGAELGLNEPTRNPLAIKLADFASKCGTAFQIQDDVIGVLGDESVTGKPVGADIREGKKTLIVLEALRRSSSAQTRTLKAALGNPKATTRQIKAATQVLIETGAIEYSTKLAWSEIHEALRSLPSLPNKHAEVKLRDMAEYMVLRSK